MFTFLQRDDQALGMTSSSPPLNLCTVPFLPLPLVLSPLISRSPLRLCQVSSLHELNILTSSVLPSSSVPPVLRFLIDSAVRGSKGANSTADLEDASVTFHAMIIHYLIPFRHSRPVSLSGQFSHTHRPTTLVSIFPSGLLLLSVAMLSFSMLFSTAADGAIMPARLPYSVSFSFTPVSRSGCLALLLPYLVTGLL